MWFYILLLYDIIILNTFNICVMSMLVFFLVLKQISNANRGNNDQ
ncbi:hypothetical protein SAMN04487995_3349 [Dyadobacter koreensis]|uniref:Uncharacterized protein n=1 Tax=Dyadobacter koreensis TaxID=408657 RepID=A0A1H6W6G1_9BACT|nr:hypothetical protein SAMN04487995_3349 [Dyadobacter koreensis]